MRDRVGDARLVRQCRIDGVGDRAVGPPVLRSGDEDAPGDLAGNLLAELLGELLNLLLGAEDDVPLEHGQPVDDDVLDGHSAEGVALDEGGPHIGA